jgi:hypothetical protein
MRNTLSQPNKLITSSYAIIFMILAVTINPKLSLNSFYSLNLKKILHYETNEWNEALRRCKGDGGFQSDAGAFHVYHGVT